ncbi:hypothetical protein DWB84_18180 [Saccharophagus sp. K07]|jgi:hypothetical protein|uniref:hypothetical protein n=1 Tax=Saccharophagus sp. K07 TaxID=2283636 RepID=UPI001652AF96|nr:hypothetical protein [Saccharophagus sp. K07]MBC6907369.1 hypothetical protein [Saccharophagus sp. K07]
MLNLGDLATLIRLTQIELFELQKAIDGPDIEASNNAAEMIVHTDDVATKLKHMYEALWHEDSGYPNYEELVDDYKKFPPFT